MANLTLATVVKRHREEVYQALKAVETFSCFLRDVKRISVRSADNNRIVSDWQVDIDGTPLEWRQEMVLDEAHQRTIGFRVLEGDLEKYEGRWTLEDRGDNATQILMKVELQWGAPGLERFVGHIFEEKARAALRGMLFAMRKALHKT